MNLNENATEEIKLHKKTNKGYDKNGSPKAN